jgi:hypothetical protein
MRDGMFAARVWSAIAILVVAGETVSCGILFYKDVCIAKSPNPRREVRVSERACMADCVVRVTVVSERGERTIAKMNDGKVGFVEVSWSPDAQRVTVYVFVTYAIGILTGYDFKDEKILAPNLVRSEIESAIRTHYSLSNDYLLDFDGNLDRWAFEVGRRLQALKAQ